MWEGGGKKTTFTHQAGSVLGDGDHRGTVVVEEVADAPGRAVLFQVQLLETVRRVRFVHERVRLQQEEKKKEKREKKRK